MHPPGLSPAEHDLLTERSDYDNSEMISATSHSRRQVSWREDGYNGRLDKPSYSASMTRDSQDTWDVHEREDTTVSNTCFVREVVFLFSAKVGGCLVVSTMMPPSSSSSSSSLID